MFCEICDSEGIKCGFTHNENYKGSKNISLDSIKTHEMSHNHI